MCKSAQEGGQRCHAHALARFQTASNIYRAARERLTDNSTDADRTHVRDLYATLRERRVEYASTPTGERALLSQALSLRAAGSETASDALLSEVRAGRELRARNAEVYKRVEQHIASENLDRYAKRVIEEHYGSTANMRLLHGGQARSLISRYKAFRDLADQDSTRHAPRGWAARHRALTAGPRGMKIRSRAAQYALYMAVTDSADTPPPPPPGSDYMQYVTGWGSLRAGDYIVGPGTREPGDVIHERKTVESIERGNGAGAWKVTFTDGTSDERATSVMTVLRPLTPQTREQLRRFQRARMTGSVTTGRDERGEFVRNNNTGQVIYAP